MRQEVERSDHHHRFHPAEGIKFVQAHPETSLPHDVPCLTRKMFHSMRSWVCMTTPRIGSDGFSKNAPGHRKMGEFLPFKSIAQSTYLNGTYISPRIRLTMRLSFLHAIMHLKLPYLYNRYSYTGDMKSRSEYIELGRVALCSLLF